MMIKRIRHTAAIACAAALALPSSAAWAESDPLMQSDAAKLRKLEVMLMVTSLRCRSSAHDFRADYSQFSTTHSARLRTARADLTRGLAAQYGKNGSQRALDRLGVKMANAYGSGHPWMKCAELKREVQALSASQDHAQLVSTAHRLLAPTRPQAVAVAQSAPTTQTARIPYALSQQSRVELSSGN